MVVAGASSGIGREAVAPSGRWTSRAPGKWRARVWIDNAGIYVMGTVEQTPLDAFERTMQINFFAAVAATKALLPNFRARRGGIAFAALAPATIPSGTDLQLAAMAESASSSRTDSASALARSGLVR